MLSSLKEQLMVSFVCRHVPLPNLWFLIFYNITDEKAKYVPAVKAGSYKKWVLACSTAQSTAETIGV